MGLFFFGLSVHPWRVREVHLVSLLWLAAADSDKMREEGVFCRLLPGGEGSKSWLAVFLVVCVSLMKRGLEQIGSPISDSSHHNSSYPHNQSLVSSVLMTIHYYGAWTLSPYKGQVRDN